MKMSVLHNTLCVSHTQDASKDDQNNTPWLMDGGDDGATDGSQLLQLLHQRVRRRRIQPYTAARSATQECAF
jgi:hypothetical protein